MAKWIWLGGDMTRTAKQWSIVLVVVHKLSVVKFPQKHWVYWAVSIQCQQDVTKAVTTRMLYSPSNAKLIKVLCTNGQKSWDFCHSPLGFTPSLEWPLWWLPYKTGFQIWWSQLSIHTKMGALTNDTQISKAMLLPWLQILSVCCWCYLPSTLFIPIIILIDTL